MNNNIKISKATIVRTIALAIVLIRSIAKRCGYDIPAIDDSAILSAVDMAIEVGIVICTFWYNNSFSQNALKADQYLEMLKGEDADV